MSSFISKRLLITLVVVCAAVGANGFIAYTQILGQTEADAWMSRSLQMKTDLEAYLRGLYEERALYDTTSAHDNGLPSAAELQPYRDNLARILARMRATVAHDPEQQAALGTLGRDGRRLARRSATRDRARQHPARRPPACR